LLAFFLGKRRKATTGHVRLLDTPQSSKRLDHRILEARQRDTIKKKEGK
jgi:hypothetical protein